MMRNALHKTSTQTQQDINDEIKLQNQKKKAQREALQEANELP